MAGSDSLLRSADPGSRSWPTMGDACQNKNTNGESSATKAVVPQRSCSRLSVLWFDRQKIDDTIVDSNLFYTDFVKLLLNVRTRLYSMTVPRLPQCVIRKFWRTVGMHFFRTHRALLMIINHSGLRNTVLRA